MTDEIINVQEPATKIKKIDEHDIELLNKAIKASEENIREQNWNIETKKRMLEEGLDVNYILTKRRLEVELVQEEAKKQF